MPDHLGLSIRQFAGAWRLLCSRCPEHVFASDGGGDYFFSGLPVAFFNALPTFLHATDAGRPLYERMGYRTVSTHTAFMERRFLEGH